MTLTKDARLMSGVTLLIVPTIMYGGWTLLGTGIGLLRGSRTAG
jgi:hypothetical protein